MEFDIKKYATDDNVTLENMWTLASKRLFGDAVISQTQNDEMKKAYFCGFAESLFLTTGISSILDDDNAVRALNKVHTEIAIFMEGLNA